uniref:Sodium/calcium exchanger membrane region domain-containing protein n=1 Tax=Alexandrium monilatum TaxID=311494 RepID=A0A7S4QZZ1_9DINO
MSSPANEGYSELGQRRVSTSKPDLPTSTIFLTNKPNRDGPHKFTWKEERGALHGIFAQWLSLLLVFVPLGLVAHYYEWSSAVTFSTNFLAIVPLASILGAATEAMATHTGQMIGGLLNATFGNAVEMIMCVQAIRAGLIRVVQGNLLGSILSNLLLVLGMAILGAGLKKHDTKFNAHGAAANMTCQVVASISICLPTMYRGVKGSTDKDVLMLSRICSLFLSLVYFAFLVFQLKTHADLFVDENEAKGDEEDTVIADGAVGAEAPPEPEPELSLGGSLLLLAVSTIVVAACSECLVDSIEGVSENYHVPKAFIGTILLPIVGNAAEHATAVSSAMKGMMDLALGVAVGSSTQIALFVVPCAVLWGWAFDTDMTLDFRTFDTACQMLSVFLVSQVLQHGNTNWLHGLMLMTTYGLIAVITWFIPEH